MIQINGLPLGASGRPMGLRLVGRLVAKSVTVDETGAISVNDR
jgi:hypothetical protein